jgi:hypothetical protein
MGPVLERIATALVDAFVAQARQGEAPALNDPSAAAGEV